MHPHVNHPLTQTPNITSDFAKACTPRALKRFARVALELPWYSRVSRSVGAYVLEVTPCNQDTPFLVLTIRPNGRTISSTVLRRGAFDGVEQVLNTLSQTPPSLEHVARGLLFVDFTLSAVKLLELLLQCCSGEISGKLRVVELQDH